MSDTGPVAIENTAQLISPAVSIFSLNELPPFLQIPTRNGISSCEFHFVDVDVESGSGSNGDELRQFDDRRKSFTAKTKSLYLRQFGQGVTFTGMMTASEVQHIVTPNTFTIVLHFDLEKQ